MQAIEFDRSALQCGSYVRLPNCREAAVGANPPAAVERPARRQAVKREEAHELCRVALAQVAARRVGRADVEDGGLHLRASFFKDRLHRPGRRERRGR